MPCKECGWGGSRHSTSLMSGQLHASVAKCNSKWDIIQLLWRRRQTLWFHDSTQFIEYTNKHRLLGECHDARPCYTKQRIPRVRFIYMPKCSEAIKSLKMEWRLYDTKSGKWESSSWYTSEPRYKTSKVDLTFLKNRYYIGLMKV
jgi:hypothetical protein